MVGLPIWLSISGVSAVSATPPRSAWEAWLDPEQKDGAAALALAQAEALSQFEPLRVSTWVNSSRNEGRAASSQSGKSRRT